jgi:hypothetical protein
MRESAGCCAPLSPVELADYHANERINDRGVLGGRGVWRAQRHSTPSAETMDIQNRVWEVTKGHVLSARSPAMRVWVLDRLTPEQLDLTEVNGKACMDKSRAPTCCACR